MEKEDRLKLVRKALIDGEKSGWVKNFDQTAFKAKLIKRYLKDK